MTATGYVQSDVVTEVNGETGDVDLSAADVGAATAGHNHDATYAAASHNHAGSAITTGTVAHARLSQDVAEAETVTFNRPTMVDPNTALDVWRFSYNGQRTGYANEYGNLRSRGAPDQVAFRCQCHSTDNGTSQVILDVTLADNTTQFSVDALGDCRCTRDLYVGRNVIYTNAWTAPSSYGTGIAGSVGSPYYDVGARLEAGGRVFLRGRVITTAGTSYSADATILTLPAGLRPAATVVYTLRSTGTGSANGVAQINSSGQFSFGTAISLTGGQQASWQLDGLNFPVAS